MDFADQDVRKRPQPRGSQKALQPVPPVGKDSVVSFLLDGVCVAPEKQSAGRSPAEVHAENKALHSEVYLSKK